jgi:uncharacterized protein YndB with AHSA1/START domain
VNVQPAAETVIRRSVTVNAPVQRAFRVFTEELGSWWPFEGHSVSEGEAETAVFEGRVGGRLFERSRDGRELLWGTILAWEPPYRFVLTWHPGRGEDTAQELEVRFLGEDNRTRVELEHRGWEKLGDAMPKVVRSYEAGWDRVLGERYAAAARA